MTVPGTTARGVGHEALNHTTPLNPQITYLFGAPYYIVSLQKVLKNAGSLGSKVYPEAISSVSTAQRKKKKLPECSGR